VVTNGWRVEPTPEHLFSPTASRNSTETFVTSIISLKPQPRICKLGLGERYGLPTFDYESTNPLPFIMSFGTNTGFGFGQSNNQTSGTGFAGFGSNNATNTGMSHSPLTQFTSTWSRNWPFVLRGLGSDRWKSSSNGSLGECRIWHKYKQHWFWKHRDDSKPLQHQRIRLKYWRYVGSSRSLASIICWPTLSRGFSLPISVNSLSSLSRYNLRCF
jgi:hypothetical protein